MSRAVETLEFVEILELAASRCASQAGVEKMRALRDHRFWATDVGEARTLQSETQEIRGFLKKDSVWGPLRGLTPVRSAVERLARGEVLETAELSVLRGWWSAVDDWNAIPVDELRNTPLFAQATKSLADAREPLRILGRVLTEIGEISERASPELHALSGRSRATRQKIEQRLEELKIKFAEDGILQDRFSDVRDGRFVLPVKVSEQDRVEGRVFEASVSKQTVFIEPKEIESLSNELRRLDNAVLEEIFKVLRDTSLALKPFAHELDTSAEILAHWDHVQAKAELGLQFGGREMEITDETAERGGVQLGAGEIHLNHTAHPLLFFTLPPNAVVRNRVALEPGRPIFLISGPNTGGKTVLLKTLGLAAVFARTGFPFPGAGTVKIPFFERLFVDVGDAQSISESLSSFSAHVLRYRAMLDEAVPRSLFLIDEINAATDPEEGAALGRAFLEHLLEKVGEQARVVLTTHDPRLKAWSLSDPRVASGSMAFDETSHTPSYRLVIGQPGRSRAIETASRLGLDSKIIKRATELLSDEHHRLEQALSKLETEAADVERLRAELDHERRSLERERAMLKEHVQTAVERALEAARTRIKKIAASTEEELKAQTRSGSKTSVRRVQDQGQESLKEAVREEFEIVFGDSAEEFLEKQTTETVAMAPEEIHVGDRVRVPKFKTSGTVMAIHGDKAKISTGSAFHVEMKLVDLEKIKEVAKQKPVQIQSTVQEADSVTAELDLRGKRFEEAMSELAIFLDRAVRLGVGRVTIIHGVGTGALREGTKKLLTTLPYVKSHRDGGPGEGSGGVTVVEF